MDLWLHVVGVLMLGLCALAQQQKDSRPPTVYLHIGPHHTGGKHIQNAIVDIQTRLGQQNVCWLGDKNPDFYHGLADAIEAQDKSKTQSYLDGIKNCLQSNRSVIVSSERFSNLTSWSFFDSVFASLPLHVIAFRREYISRLYAHYSVTNRNTLSPMLLGEFLFKAMASSEYFVEEANSRAVVRRFFKKMRDTRGAALNLTVLDIDGCLERGEDIAHAMFCRVLGVQCDVRKSANHRMMTFGHRDMLPYNLLSIVHNVLKALGCRLCPTSQKAYNRRDEISLHAALVRRYSNHSLAHIFSVRSTNLAALRATSAQESLMYRGEFGSVILFSNHSVAVNAASRMMVLELDKRRFFTLPAAMAWLRREVRQLYYEQRLCACQVRMDKFVQALNSLPA
eukprot:gene38856-47259_t